MKIILFPIIGGLCTAERTGRRFGLSWMKGEMVRLDRFSVIYFSSLLLSQLWFHLAVSFFRLESDGMPFVSPGPFFSFFCDFSATGHCKKGEQMEMGSGGGLKWRQAGLWLFTIFRDKSHRQLALDQTQKEYAELGLLGRQKKRKKK